MHSKQTGNQLRVAHKIKTMKPHSHIDGMPRNFWNVFLERVFVNL